MTPTLSIVTTLYQSALYIPEFYERMTRAAQKVAEDYNIIMVNDGSSDSSLEIALGIQQKDPRVIVIDLSRNFGHHRAIMTGLAHTMSDYVFYIDSDLEEDPELLIDFWNELKKDKGYDLVCGIQAKRKGGLFERVSGGLFNKMIYILSDVKVPENISLVRLMTRRYVNSLLLHQEKELTVIGLMSLTGFKQKYQEIKKKHKGTTTYTLSRKINLAFNYITSLTSLPLIYIFYTGLCITAFSFFILIWLVFKKIFFQIPMGWTSLVVSIWLLGGIISLFLGIIGIYIAKIFLEIKNRPLAIVKDIYEIKNLNNHIKYTGRNKLSKSR